jgi:hemolysin D
MGLFHTKDKHEFKPLLVEIEERPLNPLGRTLLWSIIVFMIIATLWLFFAKIDVVVSARGKIIPSGEVKVIQPIETGVIRKLLVHEGQYVHKDEVLVEIDPSVTETDLESKQKNLELLDIEIKRLTALIEEKKFKIPSTCKDQELIDTQKLIYKTTKQGYHQQLALIKKQLLQVEQQLEAMQLDKNKMQEFAKNAQEKEESLKKVLDIIAKSEYDTAHKEFIEYTQQAASKDHDIMQLEEKLNELKEQELLQTQTYKNKLLEELTQKRKEATLLKVEVEAIEFKNTKQRLVSPVDGYVGKLMVHTVGGVVTPAEKLITIIPKDAPLVIKATVMNQDIGFIKKGMHSAVKVDTFDFQKYGLVPAEVIHIADDAIEDEKLGPVYEIYLKLNKDSLNINGEEIYLTSGMSVTSELKVGKRRIIEFFIYPVIKYLDEGMSVR